MRTFRLALLFVCVLVAGAAPAFAQKVSVEYAHDMDFSDFHTYRWGANHNNFPDRRADAHIREKIDRVLQQKGLRLADSGPADLVITYQATLRKRREVDTYENDPMMGLGWGWGWGWGWGGGWGDPMPYGDTTQSVRHIRRGDLLVDIAHPGTDQVIFRAFSSGAFKRDPIKEDQLMDKTLDKMFSHFPPKK